MGFKLILSLYGNNMCSGRSQTGAEEDTSVCGGGSSRYLGEGRALKSRNLYFSPNIRAVESTSMK
jgi:hypothetical protein